MIYARKITKEDGHLDWNLSARELCCRIRALTPWPGAFCFIPESGRKVLLKIWQTEVIEKTPSAPPGTILTAEADRMEIACGNGALRILSLQREGKKRMDIRSFLAGNTLPAGTILE